MLSPDRRLPAAELAAAERDALGRTVLALTEASYVPRPEFQAEDRWLPGDQSSGIAESRERLAHTAERRAWAAEDAAQTALAGAVSAYVRALRAAGVRSRAVLAAVAAAVRESAAPTISADALDGVLRDAGQYGVAAYFAQR
jgi:hypothetical protein